MNYIKRLQGDRKELLEIITQTEALVAEFEAHLALPKFSGVDDDGERKDWIATGDVADRLRAIMSSLNTEHVR